MGSILSETNSSPEVGAEFAAKENLVTRTTGAQCKEGRNIRETPGNMPESERLWVTYFRY